jgi:hypothetical protein
MSSRPASDETNQSSSDDGLPLDYAPRAPRRRSGYLSPTALKRLKAWSKGTGKWGARILLSLLILFALLMGFGTDSRDAEKLREFSDSVEHWQHNPDFRQVQIEYVEQGSDAMRTKTAFVDTTRAILWLRSIPGLPDDLKINDTSLAHYTSFAKGPLSAYMRLTGEQGMADTLKMLRDLASREKISDADVREFLSQYKMPRPIIADAGAVESVRSLCNDVDPTRTFVVQKDVGALLIPHIATVAKQLGCPPDINKMNPDEQREVWDMLDSEIHETDYELWRSKQVNDWLNGVWAQVYGTMYSGLINPTMTVREVGRVGGPMMLMAWVGFGLWKRKRELAEEAGAVAPRLA